MAFSRNQSRGGFRGRYWRSNRGHASSFRGGRRTDEVAPIFPTGIVVDSIPATAFAAEARAATGRTAALRVSEAEYVGSYNWLETANSTILVPGAPPRWTPPAQVPHLNEDSADYFRDQNAARWPSYPIEPLVLALSHARPELDTSEIDIVACGSTLGNVLRFARGAEQSFHFKAEKVGKTLFLVRQESSPKAVMMCRYGYGHTFPEAYTSWDKQTSNSASHQRLVRYKLGDLSILVRSEADGYLPSETSRAASSSEQRVGHQSVEEGVDGLFSALERSHVTPAEPSTSSSLSVKRTHGEPVPQAALFDIKTRTKRTEYDYEDILPRLWINRTPNFILARHLNGVFDSPQVMDMRERVASWEERNKDAVAQFVEALRRLVKTVDSLDSAKAGVWRVGSGPFEIRTLDQDWSVLPSKLKRAWTKQKSGGGEEGEDESSSDEGDQSFLNFSAF